MHRHDPKPETIGTTRRFAQRAAQNSIMKKETFSYVTAHLSYPIFSGAPISGV